MSNDKVQVAVRVRPFNRRGNFCFNVVLTSVKTTEVVLILYNVFQKLT